MLPVQERSELNGLRVRVAGCQCRVNLVAIETYVVGEFGLHQCPFESARLSTFPLPPSFVPGLKEVESVLLAGPIIRSQRAIDPRAHFFTLIPSVMCARCWRGSLTKALK